MIIGFDLWGESSRAFKDMLSPQHVTTAQKSPVGMAEAKSKF